MAIDPKDLAIHEDILVETEVGGEVLSLPSFVTNVLPEELWLALRVPDLRLADLAPGQSMHLTFNRSGGALVVETEFLRRLGAATRQGMEKSRVYSVKRPQGVEQVQRRAHVRVDLEREVRIRSFGSIGNDKVGAGRTVNVGAGGVQLITEMPLMFGDQVRVALVLSHRDIVIAGGPVVRIDEVQDPDREGADHSKPPRMLTRVALRFDKISEEDQERITCHILAAHRRSAGRPSRSEAAVADAAAASLTQATAEPPPVAPVEPELEPEVQATTQAPAGTD